MRGTAEKSIYRLVVTGPARDQLAEHFERLFAAQGDVIVQKDRRFRERRQSAATVGADRRRGDRRQHAPEWVVPPA
jgi:hypothetical protein